ncbi:MAG: hypothetical protein AB8G99_08170, partial [Planctomycetaceae bacterium]
TTRLDAKVEPFGSRLHEFTDSIENVGNSIWLTVVCIREELGGGQHHGSRSHSFQTKTLCKPVHSAFSPNLLKYLKRRLRLQEAQHSVHSALVSVLEDAVLLVDA